MVCAILFLATDWRARLIARQCINLSGKSWRDFLVSWWVEIVGLVVIIVAFGKYIPTFHAGGTADYLQYVLFGIFALTAFLWDKIIIKVDEPLTYRTLLEASLFGDVSKIEGVKSTWKPILLDKIERKFSAYREQEVEIGKADDITSWAHMVAGFNGVTVRFWNAGYLFYHQFLGQHFSIFNPLLFVFLVGRALLNYDGLNMNFSIAWAGITMDSYLWLLPGIMLVTLILLLFGPEKYKENNAGENNEKGRCPLCIANIFFVLGVAFLYSIPNLCNSFL